MKNDEIPTKLLIAEDDKVNDQNISCSGLIQIPLSDKIRQSLNAVKNEEIKEDKKSDIATRYSLRARNQHVSYIKFNTDFISSEEENSELSYNYESKKPKKLKKHKKSEEDSDFEYFSEVIFL